MVLIVNTEKKKSSFLYLEFRFCQNAKHNKKSKLLKYNPGSVSNKQGISLQAWAFVLIADYNNSHSISDHVCHKV